MKVVIFFLTFTHSAATKRRKSKDNKVKANRLSAKV